MNLGPAEIIVIFLVALLVFGPAKLPELSRQIGRGMKELRSFQQTLKGELDDMMVDVTPDDSTPDDSTTATPARDVPPDRPGRKSLEEPAGEGSAPTLDRPDADSNADAPADSDDVSRVESGETPGDVSADGTAGSDTATPDPAD